MLRPGLTEPAGFLVFNSPTQISFKDNGTERSTRVEVLPFDSHEKVGNNGVAAVIRSRGFVAEIPEDAEYDVIGELPAGGENGVRSDPPIAPAGRVGNSNNWTGDAGQNYVPVGVWLNNDSIQITADASNWPSQQSIYEEFSSENAAKEFIEAELFGLGNSEVWRNVVVNDCDGHVTDIWFSTDHDAYYVLPSQSNDGWVHGFPGDAEHGPSSRDRESIVQQAKERVVTEGFNKLVFLDETRSATDVWFNSFIAKPASPDSF
jgi:hypothetical protein